MQNGKISDPAKKYFTEIPEFNIDGYVDDIHSEEIYNGSIVTDKFLFIDIKHLDKKSFMDKIEKDVTDWIEKLADLYKENYKNSLETLLNQIKSQFKNHLADYSIDMKVFIDNRDAMIKLGKKVGDIAETLRNSKENLNKVIWKEV